MRLYNNGRKIFLAWGLRHDRPTLQLLYYTFGTQRAVPMTALPNTILIGAAKAGTTSLCRDLEHHPDVYLYPSKETHFFSFRYDEGIDYYRSLFRPTGQKIVMEASPEYSTRGQSQLTVDRMLQHIPDARLIYMVRNPLRRLESEYVQELANGLKPVPFKDAVFDWNLIEGSLYEKNYRIFANGFSPENVHVIFFEDYLADKSGTVSALMRFLNIEDNPSVHASRQAKNTRDEKIVDPPLMKALRRIRIFERFKHIVPDNIKLMLKRQISRDIEADIVWDDALLAKVTPVIQEDARRFLERFGKPMEYWF